MPVILEPKDFAAWLDPRSELQALQALLSPAPVGTLLCQRVGPAVGSTANDGPELLLPLVDADGVILS